MRQLSRSRRICFVLSGKCSRAKGTKGRTGGALTDAATPAISTSGWRRPRRWASSSASPPRSIAISKPRTSPIWSAWKKPGAAVREHQGPSRPQGALQHDRLQPVALLPDDRRGAGRSPAQGGAAPAEEVRPQDGAGRGAGRAGGRLQPEHRRRRQDRHPQVPGAADVAARRRHVSRHRRCRHHQGPRDRPGQRRHLPHDDQGPARDRRLHLARQGRRHRPRQVVEDGQAGADRRRPTASIRCCSWSAPRACRRPRASTNIIPASRARRSSCSPPTSPACRCRRMPRSSSKAISIRTRPSPKARSASSPAITAGRAARRPTCASSACATATTRR